MTSIQERLKSSSWEYRALIYFLHKAYEKKDFKHVITYSNRLSDMEDIAKTVLQIMTGGICSVGAKIPCAGQTCVVKKL